MTTQIICFCSKMWKWKVIKHICMYFLLLPTCPGSTSRSCFQINHVDCQEMHLLILLTPNQKWASGRKCHNSQVLQSNITMKSKKINNVKYLFLTICFVFFNIFWVRKRIYFDWNQELKHKIIQFFGDFKFTLNTNFVSEKGKNSS